MKKLFSLIGGFLPGGQGTAPSGNPAGLSRRLLGVFIVLFLGLFAGAPPRRTAIGSAHTSLVTPVDAMNCVSQLDPRNDERFIKLERTVMSSVQASLVTPVDALKDVLQWDPYKWDPYNNERLIKLKRTFLMIPIDCDGQCSDKLETPEESEVQDGKRKKVNCEKAEDYLCMLNKRFLEQGIKASKIEEICDMVITWLRSKKYDIPEIFEEMWNWEKGDEPKPENFTFGNEEVKKVIRKQWDENFSHFYCRHSGRYWTLDTLNAVDGRSRFFWRIYGRENSIHADMNRPVYLPPPSRSTERNDS